LGRFDEARERLAEVLQNPPENAAPVVRFIAHQSWVEMAWGTGDPDMAHLHAAKVAELAEQAAMPYLRVRAMACAGLAKATAADFAAGARDLRAAIDFGRGARVGIEYEGRMLADFADVLFRAGDRDAALEVAKEADAVARRRTDRVAECHAALVQGTILAAAGRKDEVETRRQFARADQLLRTSGAAFYEPQLSRLRLHLEQNG
jgi:adenylate cyclase